MDINLNSLLIFRHIAQTGSFSETGRYWKISQPTVSLMVSRLESSIGLVLLERSATGTRLTPAGIEFLKCATNVCDAYLKFVVGLRSLGRSLNRELLVGVDQSWFAEEIRRALPPHVKGDPGISVCEIGENWGEELQAYQCDLVVAARFFNCSLPDGIQEAVIRRERGLTISWNPTFYRFESEEFRFPDILRSTVLLPSRTTASGFGEFVRFWCDYAYQRQPVNVVTFPTLGEAAHAASAGLGILLSPGNTVPRLGPDAVELIHTRVFETLLPEALTFGIYCRRGEDCKTTLAAAVLIGKIAHGCF